MDAQLSGLLAKAGSPSYKDRRDAASALVNYDTPESAAALLDLLRDTSDTAPIQSAAEALLKRLDLRGAELIFSAISTGDEDAAGHLLYFVACYASRVSDWTIYEFARSSLSSPDEDVRDGAAELLEDVNEASG